MASETQNVECPVCKGDGMTRHCGGQASVCWLCKGQGEVSQAEAEKASKA